MITAPDAGSNGSSRLGRARRWAAIILPIVMGAAVGLAIFKPSLGGTDYNRGFTQVGPISTMRNGPATAVLQDGRVLFAGGGNATTALASAELFDPLTRSFRPTGSMSEARADASAFVLPDGRVLVMGLRSSSNCDLYDPKTGTFQPTGAMAEFHNTGTATLLADGRVLVAGGISRKLEPTAYAELYDPVTGKWVPTGPMGMPRQFHTATLLPDGRVLVAGGVDEKQLTSAELYDPRTGTFSPTGAMAMSHDPQTAVSLADGRVLVIGGGHYTLDSPPAEIFDLKSGQFSDAGSIDGYSQRLEDLYHFYYYQQSPVRLQDGRVLFWSSLSHSFRFFDPSTGKVSVFGRFDPDLAGPVVLLSDGQVLFAGGETVLDIKGAYLYRP